LRGPVTRQESPLLKNGKTYDGYHHHIRSHDLEDNLPVFTDVVNVFFLANLMSENVSLKDYFTFDGGFTRGLSIKVDDVSEVRRVFSGYSRR
jgi:hypothetical protein